MGYHPTHSQHEHRRSVHSLGGKDEASEANSYPETFNASTASAYSSMITRRWDDSRGILSSWCFIPAKAIFSVSSSLLSILTPGESSAEYNARPTSKVTSLDGLRGVACLFVFHAHYAYSFGNCLEEASPRILSTRLMYQPFISLLWSGIAMVDVFFFISGYVLVSKPLRLLYAHNTSTALSSISSAVFRRAFRLYLPSMAMILIASVLAGLGFFDPGTGFYNMRHDDVRGPQEQPPARLSSLTAQIYSGLKDCYRLMDNTIPWGKANFPYESEDAARPSGMVYDRHLWTIPVEFRCSMLVFVMLLATSRIRRRWRLGVHVAFLVNCLFTERYPESLFIAGILLAEVDTSHRHKSSNSTSLSSSSGSKLYDDDNDDNIGAKLPGSPSHHNRLSSIGRMNASLTGGGSRDLLALVMFVPGLYLLSIPPQGPDQYPGFAGLVSMVPEYIWAKDRFIRAVGAVMTTWPVANSPVISRLFTNSFAAYLGQISFALYLVHGSLIKSVWYALQPIMAAFIYPDPTVPMSTRQFVDLWLSGYVVMLTVVLLSAHVFCKVIDERSVAFSQWLAARLQDS
ncbi:hypothetical protein PV08_07382 [Exophiala spinifera]|uniref:Acyltransferase 3 domain-containing protein n=1 Tax=Exophiala spinifera TaxID=91928 RepID=A0A0D2B6T1_9EURO|nr:uncharacterized protein PV08_07382 [Exophiala spinifera]KIW14598.1 hypothetical protein PV08_07382 [Exophiala spinifera]